MEIEKIITSFTSRNFIYKRDRKNRGIMIGHLDRFGSRQDAIKNAKNLENKYSGNNYAKHKPCTMVYKLMERLEKLK